MTCRYSLVSCVYFFFFWVGVFRFTVWLSKAALSADFQAVNARFVADGLVSVLYLVVVQNCFFY